MKILIVYGTTEGQTRKVARYVFDWLAGEGHSAELVAAADAGGVSPAAFDGVVLAASVHAGRYQAPFVDYARAEAKVLSAMPTLFLSVSLSAAGDDEDDWKGLRDCVRRLEAETGWTPGRVEHVAGAFRFSEYDFFKSWAMRWIAMSKDETVTPGTDKEYTDWDALSSVLGDWTRGLPARG